MPEVANYSRRTGVQLGGGLTEANEGDFFIRLKALPRRDIETTMADLRARIDARVPGLTIETLQLMEDLIGDLTAVPQPVEVKLFGADFALLRRVAPDVAARLAKIPGLVEVQDGLRVSGDAIDIRVDRIRAAFDGLDPDTVIQQVATLVGGRVIGQIQDGEKLIDFRLWSPQALRDRVEALPHLLVRAPDGHTLPLSRVADIRIATGQPQIAANGQGLNWRLDINAIANSTRRALQQSRASHRDDLCSSSAADMETSGVSGTNCTTSQRNRRC